MIRGAKLSDAKEITDIYNYYLETSPITLEIENVSSEEIESRISKITQDENLPFLVYIENGKLIAFAYASSWREKTGFKFSIESTIYVSKDSISSGLGSKLYIKLIEEVRKRGYKNLIGSLTLPNDASVKFHEKLGFSKVGTFKSVGFKFNKWYDVGFWQLKL